jgi:hypothetical protein
MSLLNALLPSAFARPPRGSDSGGEPARIGLRGNGYGESYMQPTGDRYEPLLAEGSLFMTNPYSQGPATASAPGTGITLGTAAQTAFADTTAAVLAIQNTLAAGSGVTRLRPDSLKLLCTAAGAGGTNYNMALVLDLATRLPGAATPYAPVALSSSGRVASAALVLGLTGLVLGAATAPRKVLTARTVKAAALAVGDEFTLRFGETQPGNAVIGGATASRLTLDVPPVLIEPGWALYLYTWAAGQTAAPNFAFELVHAER